MTTSRETAALRGTTPDQGGPPAKILPGLNLYVVWAPNIVEGHDASTGSYLATKIYEHLCYDWRNPFFGSIGVPVYFRSVPALAAVDGRPLPVEVDEAECTIVVVMVDSEMVLSPIWPDYVDTIAAAANSSNGRHLIIPVSLDKGAFNFRPLAGRNYIRYHEFDEAHKGLQLKLWLTNELCRHFRAMDVGGENSRVSPPPVRIFLSHAKADGEEATIQVLDKLREMPSVPFFDRVDIGPGYDIGNEIFERIKDAAVIVLLTDSYSDRPWCQREVLAAKSMQRPLVVVDNLQGKVFRHFPYLGNVMTIRKSPGDELEIIALTLDEALRSMVLSRRMAQMVRYREDAETTRVLFRPPEVLDGYHLIGRPEDAKSPGATPSGSGRATVLYPDPPLGPHELDALDRSLGSRFHFATPLCSGVATPLNDLTVGISLSETTDFAGLGLAETHLGEAVILIVRQLLAGGAKIAYGGDFRTHGFLDILVRLVSTYNATGSANFKPVENFQPWPNYLDVTVERAAEISLSAHLTRIPSAAEVSQKFHVDGTKPPSVSSTDLCYMRAYCLTQMRERMNAAINTRLVLGGPTTGWTGVFPGLLEEAYLAFRDGKPVYLLGGFGGCAKAIIDLMEGKERPDLNAAFDSRDVAAVERYQTELNHPHVTYEAMTHFFTNECRRTLNNGLTAEENDQLFTTLDMGRVIRLVVKGLATWKASHPGA